MEDGGSQGCVGVAFAENFDKMGRSASAAGGDYRNADGVRDGSRQLTVEACAGAVTIHGGEENLAGAAGFRFLRPGHRIAAGYGSTSVGEGEPSWEVHAALGVDSNDHGLR